MNNLKRLRNKKQLTQGQLAELIGTTQQMIYKYESGDRDIMSAQVRTVIKMAIALSCTVEDIVGPYK